MSVDFRAVRPLDGSQHAGFEELCCQLASFEPMPPGSEFVRKRGAGGDAGIECYWRLSDGREHGWQTKYFFSLGEDEWGQIDKSVEAALAGHPDLVRYTVCLPIDRTDQRRRADKQGRQPRSQLERWNERVAKWQRWAAAKGKTVVFDYWGASALTERLSRPEPPYTGRLFFWFEQVALTDSWFRRSVEIAQADAGPRYTPAVNVELPIGWIFEGFGRTPLFFERSAQLATRIRDHFRLLSSPDDIRPLDSGVANALVSIRDTLAHLDRSMDRITPDPVAEIDFPGVATRARAVGAAVQPARQQLRDALGRLGHAPAEQADPGVRGLTSRQALETVHWQLSELYQTVWEVVAAVEDIAARAANRQAVALFGDAGTGKTHLLCDVGKRRLDAAMPTVLFLSQQFSEGEPWTQMLQRLGLPCARDTFLAALDAAAQARNCRALILIDALNEGTGREMWRTHLAGMLEVLRAFPRLGLAVSCRTSYKDLVIPDGLPSDRLVEVYHSGFADHEDVATERFFDHYGIERPTIPLLIPEFTNPLFLKLFCEGLNRRGLTRFPAGLTGITAVVDFFVDAVNQGLARSDRLNYRTADRPVWRAVEALAERMAAVGSAWVELGEARSVVDACLPGTYGWEATLFRQMLSEGVLAEDAVHRYPADGARREVIEVVRFPYERFADHLIVRHLLDAHLAPDGPAAAFDPARPLGALVATEQVAYANAGWIEAISVQLPERLGVELVDVAPWAREWEPLSKAFLASVVWRAPTAFTPRSEPALDELLREPGWRAEAYDVLLMVAPVPGHPFNAGWLHERLWPLSMPERDEAWSTHLHKRYEHPGPLRRLIDWAWHAETGRLVDAAVELCATALAWCLTTSHRFARDRATKALVALLHTRPHLATALLKRFHGVNDPYVAERLYAVAYGVAMLAPAGPVLTDLAGAVHDQVFRDGRPPTHLLLRDYARGVIEAAAERGLLPAGLDVERARPLYQSPWPLVIPEQEDIEPLGRWSHEPPAKPTRQERARIHLYDSIMGYGDFARYILGTNGGAGQWLMHRLDEGPTVTNRQAIEQFAEGLTSDQRETWDAYNDAVRSYATSGLQALLDRDAPPDEELAELRGAWNERARQAEAALRTALTPVQRVRFDASIRACLDDPDDRQRRFSLASMQRWIMRRVLDLGWTEDRFGNFDTWVFEQDAGRSENKPERIGKKYQWIAYHELLALLTDNLVFLGPGLSAETERYDGPWQLNRRDIDPSLLGPGSLRHERAARAVTWWQPISMAFGPATLDEQVAWIYASHDTPDPRRLIEVVRPADGTTWLTLEGRAYEWKEERPRDGGWDGPPRRQLWLRVQSYLVRREHADALANWLPQQGRQQSWLPEAHSPDEAFLGEYPWAAAWGEARTEPWVTDWAEEMPHPVGLTTTQYVWSGGTYDCSVEESVRALLPSHQLIDHLGLHWERRGFSFVDAAGREVAIAPSALEAGPDVCLIAKDRLIQALQDSGLDLLWLVTGERQLIGERIPGERGWTKLIGVYRLVNDIVQGDLRHTARNRQRTIRARQPT